MHTELYQTLEKCDLLEKQRVEYSCQEELTLCDLHLREVEEALVAHVALTATEKHVRAVLLLYAIVPGRGESKKFINLKLGSLISRFKRKICGHLSRFQSGLC